MIHGALIVHPKKYLPSSYSRVEGEIPIIINKEFFLLIVYV